jgi:hypothetical protein
VLAMAREKSSRFICWRWLGKSTRLICELLFEIGDGSGKEYPLTCADFLYELWLDVRVVLVYFVLLVPYS